MQTHSVPWTQSLIYHLAMGIKVTIVNFFVRLGSVFLLCHHIAVWAEPTRFIKSISLHHDVYLMHLIVFWICILIAAIVFAMMFYALFKHRKLSGVQGEIIWALIPFLILIGMAIPATKVFITTNDPSTITKVLTQH